ncbi:MAG TPA: hypothetical protein VG347_04125 [Verrucomicrobiae bacterium]|nr:hypothetical protein [Verrucomicrobiae bacterium]
MNRSIIKFIGGNSTLTIICLVMVNFQSTYALQAGNFESYKEYVFGPARSYQVEFLEGKIGKSVTNAFKYEGGNIVMIQRHYNVTCQSNAFSLTENPHLVSPDKQSPPFYLFRNYGRFENDVWVQKSSNQVEMATMDLADQSSAITTIIGDVKRAENEAWCAALYGLPPLSAASIKWDGHKFSGQTFAGEDINGEVQIDNANGLVSSATYFILGNNEESATISYSYSDPTNFDVLPDMVQRRIHQPHNHMYEAEYSFSLKILNRSQSMAAFGPDLYLTNVYQSFTMISNGFP